jgi:Na+-driven multidrug efflux pump
VGYQIVITHFFQSIGKAKVSIFLSLSRQLLFLMPILLVLPRFFGLDGVWFALPSSDLIAAIVAFAIMRKYMRQFKVQHQQQDNG